MHVHAHRAYASCMCIVQDTLAEANATAEEVISAISTTRAFSAEGEESARYASGMQKYVGTVFRQARLYFFFSSLTFTFLPYLTYCLILFFAAQLIHTPEGCSSAGSTSSPPPPPHLLPHGELAPLAASAFFDEPPECEVDGPKLVSFVFYMQSLFAAFQSLGNIYTALAQAVGAADKVIKWIHRTPAILPPDAPIVPTTCRGEVRRLVGACAAACERARARATWHVARDTEHGARPTWHWARAAPHTHVATPRRSTCACTCHMHMHMPHALGTWPRRADPARAISHAQIQLVNVHFRYQLRPERPILSGLNLHAAPGEVVALCGPSGGGKSSIICLIERFYTPERGDVLLDGIPISQLCPHWFHRQVALVGQVGRSRRPSTLPTPSLGRGRRPSTLPTPCPHPAYTLLQPSAGDRTSSESDLASPHLPPPHLRLPLTAAHLAWPAHAHAHVTCNMHMHMHMHISHETCTGADALRALAPRQHLLRPRGRSAAGRGRGGARGLTG